MTTTKTRSQFFRDPVLDPLHRPEAPPDPRAPLREHFEQALQAIDAALAPGWHDDRTNLAAPELVARLPSPSPTAEASNPPRALRVFERVRDMLDLDEQRAAALVGISRNTPNNWRHGDHPKGSTTKRLYELAAVLDLVATKEQDLAAWSRGIAPDGRSWLELAADPDGPAAILRALRGDLLTSRPASRLEATDDEDAGAAPAPVATSDTVRRRPGPRRRPR